jgi:murein DD-endopeptidase MepM/ murein hydrolase activator NlpD
MRPPLDNWNAVVRSYRFGEPTFYSPRHLGVDYVVPTGTPVYAPSDGRITVAQYFSEGGNTVWYAFDGVVMRCLHLSTMRPPGFYREGEIIGYTGNTGRSTGPHLHLDISRNAVDLYNFNNFIDPDLYFVPVAGDTNTMKITEQNINDLYIAIYRRPADLSGKAYWIGRDVMEFVKAAPQQAEWKIYTTLLQAGKLIEEFGRTNR